MFQNGVWLRESGYPVSEQTHFQVEDQTPVLGDQVPTKLFKQPRALRSTPDK